MTLPVVDREHAPAVAGHGRWAALAAAASLVLAVVVPLATALDLAFPGRAVLAVVFVLVVPGLPVGLLLGRRQLVLTVVLTVAPSLAALLIVSTALLALDFWHPLVGLVVLAALHLAGLAAWAARGSRGVGELTPDQAAGVVVADDPTTVLGAPGGAGVLDGVPDPSRGSHRTPSTTTEPETNR